MLKNRGMLEESSELTHALTSEEIVGLNQRRPVTSPSEKLRLFSFTKRHLKLPFKGKGKRDRDLRDKLVSPDKDFSSYSGVVGGVTTPTKHRRYSPTTTKSPSSQDKPDGE